MKSIQSLIQRKVVVLHDDATVDQAARANVKAQLPKDLYALFSMTEVELDKKKAAA
jgi:hypothetical protein